MRYTIERQTGQIPLTTFNLFVDNITDMVALEDWEERLDKLGEPYVIAFQEKAGKVVYSIFCNTRKKGSSFK